MAVLKLYIIPSSPCAERLYVYGRSRGPQIHRLPRPEICGPVNLISRQPPLSSYSRRDSGPLTISLLDQRFIITDDSCSHVTYSRMRVRMRVRVVYQTVGNYFIYEIIFYRANKYEPENRIDMKNIEYIYRI